MTLDLIKKARQSPFYLHRLEPFQQWADLPFTTKGDLRTSYPFGMLAVPRVKLASYHESTGSTGEPTSSYFTPQDWDHIVERFLRNGAGLHANDTILIKTPYSMVTTAHQMHQAALKAGALIVPADNRSSNMSYPKVIRLLRDLSVTVAWSMPTELLLWAEAARLLGLDPATDFPSLTRFIVAGESLSLAKKNYIERVWGGKKIFQDYGSTETGSLAGDCVHGKMHLWQDHFLFEVWDPRRRVAASTGRGQLVLTSLTREAMPLIRYLIEDEVEISESTCSCGSRQAVIQVLGRPVSQIVVGHQKLYQSQIEEAIYSIPEEYRLGMWRVRKHQDALEVEVEVEVGNHAIVCDEVAHEIFRRFGLQAEVHSVAPLTIVNRNLLLQQASFKKPRFLFSENEDWNDALNYAL